MTGLNPNIKKDIQDIAPYIDDLDDYRRYLCNIFYGFGILESYPTHLKIGYDLLLDCIHSYAVKKEVEHGDEPLWNAAKRHISGQLEEAFRSMDPRNFTVRRLRDEYIGCVWYNSTNILTDIAVEWLTKSKTYWANICIGAEIRAICSGEKKIEPSSPVEKKIRRIAYESRNFDSYFDNLSNEFDGFLDILYFNSQLNHLVKHLIDKGLSDPVISLCPYDLDTLTIGIGETMGKELTDLERAVPSHTNKLVDDIHNLLTEVHTNVDIVAYILAYWVYTHQSDFTKGGTIE